MSTITTQVYSNCTPVVKSGETLKINVNQTLGGLLDTAVPEDVYVTIEGPQVSVTPEGVYPASGSDDTPDEFFAHAAFARRTLPWERLGPDWKQNKPRAPWLALLLLKESEMKTQSQGAVFPTTVKDLKDTAFRQKLRTDLGLPDAKQLQVIFISNKILKEILPKTADEVELLCHMKRKTEDGVDTDGAIVICNRLPDSSASELHTALLVSLEKRDEIFALNYFQQNANKSTGFIVLHHWTFTPSQGGDFEQVMRAIGYRPNGGVLRFGNLPKPLSAGQVGPLGVGFDALIEENGYLREEIENTQPGKIEIRGPLRPFAVARNSKGFAVRAAPQEFLGAAPGSSLDYSHAAAFAIGRLLALGDSTVLEALRDVQVTGKKIDPPVAIHELPVALQKRDWVVNPAELGDPWTSQIKGAIELRGPVPGDFTGIAEQAGVWKDTVLQQLRQMSAAVEPPVESIDILAFSGEILAKRFKEVINAAISSP